MAERYRLCADDYAQNAGISRGIRMLAAEGRLQATSAMTNAPGWPEEARAFASLRPRCALGLHLTLTHGAPLGPMPLFAPKGVFPPLGRVMALSLGGRLRGAMGDEIAAEIARQIAAFVAHAGMPDHVDGHQHVHALPGIRGRLLAALARQFPGQAIGFRDPSDRLAAILARPEPGKALVVAGLALGLAKAARARGLRVNRGFSGFSGFGPRPYAAEFPGFLRRLGPEPLVMCHPGEGDDPSDPLGPRRGEELAYLRGLPHG